MAPRRWDRRRFVTATLGGAALAASPRLASASAQGANDRIRVGVAGTGGRARGTIAAGGARVRWNAAAGKAEKA